jgi:hypothetical protein
MWMIDTVVVDTAAFSRLAFSSAMPLFARHLDGHVPMLSFATVRTGSRPRVASCPAAVTNGRREVT